MDQTMDHTNSPVETQVSPEALSKANTALVLGIIGCAFCLFLGGGLIVSLVLGIIGLVIVSKSVKMYPALAAVPILKAARVLNIISTVLGGVLLISIIMIFALLGFSFLIATNIQQHHEAAGNSLYNGYGNTVNQAIKTTEYNITEDEPLRVLLNPVMGNTSPIVVQTHISLVYPTSMEDEAETLFEDHYYSIRESIENTIAEQSPKDVNTPDGLDNLRSEIVQNINNILEEPIVQRVILTQFDVISASP